MKKPAKTSARKKTPAPRRKSSGAAPAGEKAVEESSGVYSAAPTPAPSFARAKTFRVGGSQAVRLPKAFRLPDGEVLIEKRGDEIVLKPAPKPMTTEKELLAWLRESQARFGKPTDEWPDIERPGPEANRPMSELEW